MKNKSLLTVTMLAILVAATSIVVTSCKKKFDEPPAYIAPNVTANTTIKALKALHTSGGFEPITTDVIIKGIVIANDQSGNFYKEMYIQDATASIALELDGTSLYGNYPVGREIFIKCKGLYLSDYGGMIQLGFIDRSVPTNPTLTGIPSTLFDTYIAKGSTGNAVPLKTITAITSQLTTGMQDTVLGSLIQLNGYEFGKGDTSKIYADTSAAKKSVNLTIKDCGGVNNIILRSSGYANFAGKKVPRGNGTILGIYTMFNGVRQLILRDTNDIQFTGNRCYLYEEDFNNYAVTGTAPLVLTGWKNIMETGDVPYTLAAFSGSTFPKVSAFSSAVLATTNISTWLISPDITLPSTATAATYSFTCSRRYVSGTLKAYVSTNYTGGTPASATWILLGTVPNGSATAFTLFDPFGPYNVGTYAGQKINLAFRYEATAGTAASAVATYEVDDLKISK
jgi:hypothetical protein